MSPEPWFVVGTAVMRDVIKIFHLCGSLGSRTDRYLLIPLQELIDLKMLQCKRVVNGKCSPGLRIGCVQVAQAPVSAVAQNPALLCCVVA